MLSRLSKTKVDIVELEASLKNKKEVKEMREKYQTGNELSLETIVKGARKAFNGVSGKQSKQAQTTNQNEVREQSNVMSEEAQTNNQNDAFSGSGTGRNMTIEEASNLLQCSVTTIRKLVTEKTLKAPNDSKQFVTRASVEDHLIKKQKKVRTAQDTEPILHVVNN